MDGRKRRRKFPLYVKAKVSDPFERLPKKEESVTFSFDMSLSVIIAAQRQ